MVGAVPPDLKVMYPAADIPVLQMSIPTHGPQRLSSWDAACGRCAATDPEQALTTAIDGYFWGFAKRSLQVA